MKVFQSAYEAGKWAPGSVCAIGKFDGVHLGHKKMLGLVVKRARALAARSLVVTFDPHPQEFFSPGSHRPIVALERKLALIAELGIDGTLLLPFNGRLACQVPEAFARDVLGDALKAVEVFVGRNFCFGKDRSGRVDTLESLGKELGFLVHAVALATAGGGVVSSARIRLLLDEGKIAEAERLLGHKL